MASAEIPQGTDFVWHQADQRLEAQMRQADSLDTKAGALVGLHALAAGLIGSAARSLTGAGRWIAIAIIMGLLLSGSFAFLAYRIEAYSRDPSPADLWRFADWTESQIRYRFLSTRLRSLDENAQKLRSKARHVTRSLVGLAVIGLGAAIAGIADLVVH